MKQVYRYDEEGKYIEPVIIGDEEETPVDCTEKELPQPNYKPIFNGSEWVETITQEELDAIKNQPIVKTPLEKLQDENAELRQQIEQQNADMQAFMDYILGQVGGN